MPKKTSNSNYKRLEILGVLLCAVSLFIIVSLLGHDPSEELAISPNAQVNNPMGILGLLVSHSNKTWFWLYFFNPSSVRLLLGLGIFEKRL